ncbi:MAG: PulJ/GspJ family protein [Planctomycetota bacterium]|jgi:prepilin-type N-terminal cleavage/methylation domain-containing protein
MNNTRYKNGLTLIELLVAMVVTGIVMTAVATLAYALSSANDVTDNTSEKQAQIRFAAMRISDLIRHSRLVCYADGDDIAVWRADDNDDGRINIGELVYIESGPANDYLYIGEFPSTDSTAIAISSIGSPSTNWWLAYSSDINYTMLIPQCSNVLFGFDVLPPQSKFVNINFNILENNIVRQYQISAALRGWAGNLLDGGGEIVSDDD